MSSSPQHSRSPSPTHSSSPLVPPQSIEEHVMQQLNEHAQRALQQEKINTVLLQKLDALTSTLTQQQLHVSSTSSSSSNAPLVSPLSSTLVHRLDKVFKPKPFTAERGSNLDYWCADLDRYFNAMNGNMTGIEQVTYVQLLLAGPVGVWYDNCVQEGQIFSSWSQLKDALLARFRPVGASKIARASLDTLQHQSSIASYNEIFQNVVMRIVGFPETEKVYHYIKGLKQHIRIEVDRENPTTLNTAMIAAQTAEQRLRSSSSNLRAPHMSSNTYVSKYSSPPPMSNTSAPMELGNVEGEYEEHDDGLEVAATPTAAVNFLSKAPTTTNRVPTKLTHADIQKLQKEGRCFFCKQTGHMKRECPKMKFYQPKKL